MNSMFFELLQLSIGVRKEMTSAPTSEDWYRLYAMAGKQALLGVCFAGMKAAREKGMSVPSPLYMQWLAVAAGIQQRNELLNRRCREIQEMCLNAGLRSCILKGQGNTLYYNAGERDLSLLRQSGDIDLWVEGGYERVMEWVTSVSPSDEVTCHHAHLHCFEDVDVEVHYSPIRLPNLWRDRVLCRYFAESGARQFSHRVTLPTGEEIVSADRGFNLVFQLLHIYHHLFTEGVGLRQMMDYYFLLCSVRKEESSCQEAVDLVSRLGLERFASAMMWVLGHVFGLCRESMLWAPSESDGRFLLGEIMQSGNFGKQDARQNKMNRSKWDSFWTVHFKTFRLWRFDHWAWFWSPVFRIRWKVWQKKNGYR